MSFFFFLSTCLRIPVDDHVLIKTFILSTFLEYLPFYANVFYYFFLLFFFCYYLLSWKHVDGVCICVF